MDQRKDIHMPPRTFSRRQALTLGTMAGISAGAGAFHAAARPRYRRTSRSAVEKIEIGIIGTGGYSHARVWATTMNPPLDGVNGDYLPRMTGMAATMCWDPNPEYAADFAKRYGMTAAADYDSMVGKVDAVITTDYDLMAWQPRLIEPYLRAGMPVLVERPMALSLADARRITELSKHYNAPIHVPSAFETRFETTYMQEQLRALGSEGAVITGVLMNHQTNDYPAHATHAVYQLFRILEPDVQAVRFISDGWWSFKEGVMNWRVKQKSGQDYTVTIVFAHGYRTVIQTTGGIIDESIHIINDRKLDPYSRNKWHNYPTMYEFAKVIESGRMVESYEHILAKNKVVFAGWYSHLEKDGGYVDLAAYPDEWAAPAGLPPGVPDRVREQHRDEASIRRMESMFP